MRAGLAQPWRIIESHAFGAQSATVHPHKNRRQPERSFEAALTLTSIGRILSMPKAVPLTGMNRVWRWARYGAALGLLVYLVVVVAGILPMATWDGRGIFFNLGRAAGALIAGAFLGGLLAMVKQVLSSR